MVAYEKGVFVEHIVEVENFSIRISTCVAFMCIVLLGHVFRETKSTLLTI